MDPAFWGVKITRAAKTTSIAVLGERDIAGELPVKSKGAENAVLLTSTRAGAEDALAAYAKMSFHLPEFLDLKV